ncbi:MAG: coproporphyrinogen III oxidase family protein, partial [Deltaproteobacteria bacterium]
MSDTLSVYIHIPFCLKKCSYCDFYSIQILSFLPAYVKSLQQEIQIRTDQRSRSESVHGVGMDPQKVNTIYFGGGTPSLLPLEDVKKILTSLYTCYQVSRDAEVTFEVNPGTVDQSYLSGLKSLGVNRLSIGVQSFDADKIKVLGRIHTIEASIEAIGLSKSAGFDNIGLDLIYGTPGETLAGWTRDLQMALEFKVVHLSCYMLTLEPGTPLHTQYERGLFTAASSGLLTDLFMATSAFLEQHGYDHYEISNFARGVQNRSQHNCAYWQMTPYDGFGPGAHSFGFFVEKGQGTRDSGRVSPVRSWNLADVNAYIQALSLGQLPVHEREMLSLPQQVLERVMLGLRTSDGIDITAVEKMTGQDFLTTFAFLLDRLERQGLGAVVTGSGKRFLLTLSG